MIKSVDRDTVTNLTYYNTPYEVMYITNISMTRILELMKIIASSIQSYLFLRLFPVVLRPYYTFKKHFNSDTDKTCLDVVV